MNDRAALEVALAANPDDFATHAAYADLLTEQGDPRGDYIRLQLALEDRHQPVERLRAMEQEAFTIRKEYEAEWLGPLAKYVNLGTAVRQPGAVVEVTYRRGWIDTVRVRRLEPEISEALAECPIVGLMAELEVISDSLQDLTAIPLQNLAWLRWEDAEGFEFEMVVGDGQELAVPESPLDGWFHPVTPASPSVPLSIADPEMFSPRTLPRLRELSLRTVSRGDEAVAFLIRSGLLGQLRGIDLRDCGITDDGAELLATHPAVPKLDYLHLDDNHISPIGIDALAAVGVVISQRQHLGPTPGGDDEPADGEIAF